MGKLTLRVEDDLIAAAKNEAASRRTSVSKLVSDCFRAFAAKSSEESEVNLPPVTASLVGCIRGADPNREAYIDHLEKKHS